MPPDAPEPPFSTGVDWTTGAVLPEVSPGGLDDIPEEVDAQSRAAGATRGLAVDDVDPNNLAEAGWGIIFGPGVSAGVRQALQPLIAHRQAEAGSLFASFEGARAYQPDDTVRSWLNRQQVTFASVNPQLGVPLYLLIVASPQDIPFEFQYLLDAYWNVGRLHFDDEAMYGEYVSRLLAYERAATLTQSRRVTIFAPLNPADRATGFFHNQVAKPFVEGSTKYGLKPIGAAQQFAMDAALKGDATKARLEATLAGTAPGGRPAVLFTGSHGIFAGPEVAQRVDRIGGLVTQDWNGPGTPLSAASTLCASDLADIDDLGGLLHFMFACYGGGCPAVDTYTRLADGTPKPLLEQTIVSRLPQAMLARGALGIVSHVDRVFAFSFQTDTMLPQTQDLHQVLQRMVRGQRLGQCLDAFNLRWAVLSAELTGLLRTRELSSGQVPDAVLADRWLKRDDARNYIVLGDPAVRLRTELLT